MFSTNGDNLTAKTNVSRETNMDFVNNLFELEINL